MPCAAARTELRCIGVRCYMLSRSCSSFMAKIVNGIFSGSQNHSTKAAEASVS